jgi:hypothetical protein
VIFVFDVSFFDDQVLTRGGGFYRVDMNFSYLRGNVVNYAINLSTERLEPTFNYETN